MKQSKGPGAPGYAKSSPQCVITDSFGSIFSSHIFSLSTNNDWALILLNELLPNPLPIISSPLPEATAKNHLSLKSTIEHWVSGQEQLQGNKLVVRKCVAWKRKNEQGQKLQSKFHMARKGEILHDLFEPTLQIQNIWKDLILRIPWRVKFWVVSTHVET